MNKKIMKQMGFGQQVDLVEKGMCPFCRKKIDMENEFRNFISRKEFLISGQCQECQDKIFGKD